VIDDDDDNDMAASKVICQNVQHILSGAQQCKCENRCVNCFK
jgi:hypothetical protein